MSLVEQKEILNQRYPFFEIVGPVGSGTSTLARFITEATSTELLPESFEDNPYLEDFYTKDPANYSFNTQMFFQAMDGTQRKKASSILAKRPLFVDKGEKVNLIIAGVQRKMGWMTDEQFEVYESAHQRIYESGGVVKPDVSIAVVAKTENVIDWIRKRGRPMELIMLQRFPRYFPTIVEEFNTWLKTENHVVVVESDKHDIISDGAARARVLGEVKNRLGYFLHTPTQLNLKGSDGSELIFPGFLRPQSFVESKKRSP